MSRVNHDPVAKGWGSSVPQISRTSYMSAYSIFRNNQNLHGDQTGRGANFCMVDDEKTIVISIVY